MSEPTSNVPEQPKSKSGLSPMAWIAIGCGVVILLAFVAFMALGAFVFKKGKEVAQEVSGSDSLGEFMENLEEDPARTAAEMAIRLNPDLEILETDAEKGVISFWNPTTEETWTVDFEDAAAGRFKVTGSEGEYTLDGEGGGVTVTTPEGVTRIGASADVGDVPSWVELYPGFTSAEGSYHSVQGDTVAGTVSLLVPDEPEEVKELARGWLGHGRCRRWWYDARRRPVPERG